MSSRARSRGASVARMFANGARSQARTIVYATWPTLAQKRRCRQLIKTGQLVIGRHSFFLPNVIVHEGEHHKVVIGSFCSIYEDVRIFVGGNHRPDWISTYAFRAVFKMPGRYVDGCPTSKGDVIIGHDVWIGAGATLLSGVHVGNGAVIGAESVVAKDVAPYSIVVGNPAREVRKRFPQEQIEMLEQLAWWDWPMHQIIDNVALLCSPNVDAAVDAYGPGR